MKAWRQRSTQQRYLKDMLADLPVKEKLGVLMRLHGKRLGHGCKANVVRFLPVPSALFQNMMAHADLNFKHPKGHPVIDFGRPLQLNGLPA